MIFLSDQRLGCWVRSEARAPFPRNAVDYKCVWCGVVVVVQTDDWPSEDGWVGSQSQA